MVDRRARNTGFFCGKAEKSRIRFVIPHIRKTNRKSHVTAKPQNRIYLLLGNRFHDQLGQGAERHLAAVVLAVKLRNHGKSFLDGMGSGKTAAFKADAGQVCIYLHNGFQRLRADARFRVFFRLRAILL